MFSSCSRRTKKRPSPSSLPTEARDWAALPSDALHEVFLKLDARDIVFCAEVVCKAWRRVVVEEPTLWRHVDMSVVPDECIDTAMRDAVDRRAGLLESFSGPWDDEFLLYIGARAYVYATDEILIEAVKKLPHLEDLDISPPFLDISTSDKLFVSVCKACPRLKNLKIMFTLPSDYDFGEALLMECYDGDIYRTPMMCELRSIVLFNYVIGSEHLTAILDNCPLLESLHITGYNTGGDMDEQLQAKCARLKNLTILD